MSQDLERHLVLLIGIPGSGKSSLAAGLQQTGCAVVSTDQIRVALFGDAAVQGDWRLIWQRVEQDLQAAMGRITVYDATNTRRSARRAVIRLARSTGYHRVTGLWLNPPLEICLARNQQRPRQVPEAVIRRMHRQLWSQPPKLREGLDLLLHYGGIASQESEDWLRHLLPTQGMEPAPGQDMEIAPGQGVEIAPGQGVEIAPWVPAEPNQDSPKQLLR